MSDIKQLSFSTSDEVVTRNIFFSPELFLLSLSLFKFFSLSLSHFLFLSLCLSISLYLSYSLSFFLSVSVCLFLIIFSLSVSFFLSACLKKSLQIQVLRQNACSCCSKFGNYTFFIKIILGLCKSQHLWLLKIQVG